MFKSSIANPCLGNAFKKSCHHRIYTSLNHQYVRLTTAVFPKALQVSVSEGLVKRCRVENSTRDAANEQTQNKRKVAVVPYLHKTVHCLQKLLVALTQKFFFKLQKNLAVCGLTGPCRKSVVGCSKRHGNHFVDCEKAVLYELPLSCGKKYIG